MRSEGDVRLQLSERRDFLGRVRDHETPDQSVVRRVEEQIATLQWVLREGDKGVNVRLWFTGMAMMAAGVFCFSFGMTTDTAWLSVLGFIAFPSGLLVTLGSER